VNKQWEAAGLDPITPHDHDPQNDETPDNTGVLKYRYRDSKPASEE
jgi:hypothetical protein